MMSAIVDTNMQVSAPSASTFRNMAVWEAGYNVCLDICRAADQFTAQDNTITQQLRGIATQVPLNLSRSASYKPGKKYLRFLKASFVSTKQLSTLLMLSHDLNYMNTEKFLELNSKVNIFSSKLWKYIHFIERKVKQRSK